MRHVLRGADGLMMFCGRDETLVDFTAAIFALHIAYCVFCSNPVDRTRIYYLRPVDSRMYDFSVSFILKYAPFYKKVLVMPCELNYMLYK